MENTILEKKLIPSTFMAPVGPYDVMYKYGGRLRKVESYNIIVVQVKFRDAPDDFRAKVYVTLWDYQRTATHSKLIKMFEECESYVDALYKGSTFAIDHMYNNHMF